MPEIGTILLKDLTTDDVQKFYNKMAKKKFAPATVKKNHQILSMCLSKAVDNCLIGRNPAKTAELPKLDDDEARAMTEKEMNIFLDELTRVKGPFKTRGVWPVIFLTLLGTGLREGEVLSLR
ncbi:MAG: phage integrase SAM-like domain-containing protein [Desulfosporosinus sp.]|nr:phage integrase SAM-like domain-containing protein [Desulfosporosinus sp.]